ncbi:putative procollagen-lysine,2-oxoglutarate 5-dioxygenase [Schistosoma mansoni]|uniref:putative procollagen-lysine,2-oxoglutarate 5-dioxygenase n=1 Tax=Schistosoma mansoni TaxID=6183 RepID=UPI0001A63A91|nr:putative procollagen-lysine,2-oxoglutarate 5-dioxygenase [Schistosoma mansoni]|eukprot:XP_018655001.1 putative procollagen-lysine,2-oxoglutarate 5-dioxygenase [Schistosoma mansoni]
MTLFQSSEKANDPLDSSQDRGKEFKTESLLCRLKYQNNLPELPFDPKFLVYPLEPSRFLQYVATSLERNYKHELLTETDVGVEVDLIDPDVFRIDKRATLHPDDERLLEDEAPTFVNARKSRHQKLGYNVKRHLNEEIVYRDRESQINAIEETFKAAEKPIHKHYSKPNVHALEVLPVLPDFTLWRYPCAQVIFDDDPSRKNKTTTEQKEEVNQAMIRGMVDESGDHFVAYFLPTEQTKQLRRLDAENQTPYTEDAAYEYELTREYNWNVKNKTMANYEENYFFCFRKDGVYYNELETRVRLSKRRKLNQSGTNVGALQAPKTRLIVHHRDFTDEELKAQTDHVLVLTVATEKNDALQRFLRSCNLNGFKVKVLGEGSHWKGGHVAKSTGGGQKVNLLKEELAKGDYKPDQLILFVDSYDVVFMQNVAKLLEEYEKFKSKVIFSAEEFCWPQPSLQSSYPEVKPGEKRYLNSGGFIGPTANLIKIVNHEPIKDDDDDQLYYTKIFLDSTSRTLYDIELDKTSRIFQNLNGAFSDVELHFNDVTGYLFNKIFSTTPIIAHGNGPIKVEFNSLSNYLAYSWSPTKNCQQCDEDNIEIQDILDYPLVVMGIFIEQGTPFIERFFERIAALSYPKSRLHVVGHMAENSRFQSAVAESFNQTFGHQYFSVNWLEENLDEETARRKNVFMFVDNQMSFGYLTDANNYTKGKLHNDLWQTMDNPQDWEEQYIHPQYFNFAKPEVTMTDIAQPCPDVFWFPLVSETFCKHLIEEVENYGQWSTGDNYDPRLEGGYENVPTRDIHMRQIGWEEHWLHVLEKYVHKIQKKLFQGYDDKPWARMNFVVRYKPDEQPSLRPHHDASSYTINIGLNQPGKDYKGGGIRYNRYNCSIVDTRVGWALVSPGRVTHLHEGLPTTGGTRYIFVTFVNP